MICKKCGANIQEGFEYCMKCGAKVEAIQEALSEEASLNEGQAGTIAVNKKKPIIIAAIIVVVIALIIGIISGTKMMGTEKKFFEDVPWGADFETVKARIEGEFVLEGSVPNYNESDGTIGIMFANFEDMEGIDAMGSFKFNYENKLESITLFVSPSKDSLYAGSEMVDEIVQKYDERYGEGDINFGHFITYSWENEKIIIEATEITDNLFNIELTSK